MTGNPEVDRLIIALARLRRAARAAGQQPAWPPPPPPGWAHIPVVLHDLIWNLDRNYDIVTKPIIERYVSHIVATHAHHDRERLLSGHQRSLAGDWVHHTTAEGRTALEDLGAVGRRRIAGNNSPAHTRVGAPLRADTIVAVHTAFIQLDIDTVPEAREIWNTARGRKNIDNAIRSIPGLGDAASAYFPILIGLESIKPDRHVVAWFERKGIGTKMVRDTTVAAVEVLNERDGGGWTVAGTDHAIWRTESGRQLRTR